MADIKDQKEIPFNEVISFSELFKWDTCKRQYYYSYILNLRSLETKDPMVTGTKGHKLLQDFYNYLQEGKTKDEALKLVQESAQRILLEDGKYDGTILKSWMLVDNYIRENEFKNEAVLVENRFLFPASRLDTDPALSDIQIGFTPDVVFKRPGDFYDVEDYKFVGRAWSKKKMNRFQQAKLYQIFLRRMGYNVSRSTVRFFNTTTGLMSSCNYTLEANEEKTLIDDFIEAVREVVRFRKMPEYIHAKARRTMNYTACQFCDFEYVCTLESKGQDVSKTLKYQFETSKYDYNS